MKPLSRIKLSRIFPCFSNPIASGVLKFFFLNHSLYYFFLPEYKGQSEESWRIQSSSAPELEKPFKTSTQTNIP